MLLPIALVAFCSFFYYIMSGDEAALAIWLILVFLAFARI